MVTPGIALSPFVCILMQITGDPMRSTKLLLDLKVASGDFLPLGSTYLRLLLKDIDIESKLKALKLSWIKRLLDSNFHPWETLAANLLEPVEGI